MRAKDGTLVNESEFSASCLDFYRKHVKTAQPSPPKAHDALGVLPLCCDWAGCHAIRPDGEIIVFLTDHPDGWRIEDDPRLRNTAIYQGSLKYPELKELIPIRPPDAQVCSNCQGTGTDPMALQLKSDHIICFCGGLGWIP